MPGNETTLALLQVVALVLPAVAIYLEILSSRHDLSAMEDGLAANYHAVRLTFIYLLLAGVTLLISLTSGLLAHFIGSTPATLLSSLLDGVAMLGIGLALLTFVLPVVFSEIGLSDSRSILWPYRNVIHRFRDSTTERE